MDGSSFIRSRMKELGLTQDVLARHLDVSQGRVSQILSEPLTCNLATRLGEILGSDPLVLLVWQALDTRSGTIPEPLSTIKALNEVCGELLEERAR